MFSAAWMFEIHRHAFLVVSSCCSHRHARGQGRCSVGQRFLTDDFDNDAVVKVMFLLVLHESYVVAMFAVRVSVPVMLLLLSLAVAVTCLLFLLLLMVLALFDVAVVENTLLSQFCYV